MVRKIRWKPLELRLPGKSVNRNQYCIPAGTAEINFTIKDLKDAEAVPSMTYTFNSLIWPVQKTDGSCRMRVDYQKLNQVMILIAAATPDVTSLVEQINVSHGT